MSLLLTGAGTELYGTKDGNGSKMARKMAQNKTGRSAEGRNAPLSLLASVGGAQDWFTRRFRRRA
jgi:hypothetical protein